MRILKISDVFFPRVNGVSTSIETFRHDLGLLGHEVVLIAPAYPGAAADPRETADSFIRRVPARAVPRDSRSQCNQLDAVIAPSHAMREALLTYGINKRIDILPTGLPAERFRAGDGSATAPRTYSCFPR